MGRILEGKKQFLANATTTHCDNQSTIAMKKNLVNHSRTGYIETMYHFIPDFGEKGSIQMANCNTNEQLTTFSQSHCYSQSMHILERNRQLWILALRGCVKINAKINYHTYWLMWTGYFPLHVLLVFPYV